MEWGRSSTLLYSLSLSSADPNDLQKANDATVLAEQVAESSGRPAGSRARFSTLVTSQTPYDSD